MSEISVTIPVYNVEDCLRRCLDTVLDQTFKLDYEIICVDDGSTDSSLQILKEYDKKYPGKFKIIHQENRGLSEARNTAMKYVTGKYTMFVDSDDFIARNALEGLYNYAEAHNSEVVVFDFLRCINGTMKRQHNMFVSEAYKDTSFNIETARPFVFKLIWGGTWSRFYLTDLIKDIKFEPGLRNQDVCHWLEVFAKAKRINYYPVPFYCYVMYRKDAITMQTGKSSFDVFKAFKTAEKTLKKSGYFEKYKDMFYMIFSSYLVWYLKKIQPELRRKFIDKIKKYQMKPDYEKILASGYTKIEKEELLLIKFIKENDYNTTEKMFYRIKIW